MKCAASRALVAQLPETQSDLGPEHSIARGWFTRVDFARFDDFPCDDRPTSARRRMLSITRKGSSQGNAGVLKFGC
jgi:hypothetical protein